MSLKFFAYIILSLIAFLMYLGIYSKHTKVQDFTVNGGTFDIEVRFVITPDTVLAHRLIEGSETGDFDCRGITWNQFHPITVWMPNTTDTDVISHELYHVTQAILYRAGLEYSDETEEIYAYEMQYLNNQFYNNIRK